MDYNDNLFYQRAFIVVLLESTSRTTSRHAKWIKISSKPYADAEV